MFIIFRNELSLRPGIAEIPPFFPLYFPGSFLLILAGVAVMAKGLMLMQYEIRFCLICESITKQFRADPRFRDGEKIGIPTFAKNADKNSCIRARREASGPEINVSIGSTITSR
ncbi:MAG: hypothetical protein ACHQ03_04170 [Candidatus Bathyarchaeia archaeon]